MGNSGSSGNHRRRNSNNNHNQNPNPYPQIQSPVQQQPQPPQPPEIPGNRYVFAAATPHPPRYVSHNPNASPFYHYNGFIPPPPPPPLPAPFDRHHQIGGGGGPHGGRYPCGGPIQPPPYVEHQKAVTIRNDVNLKKETLRVEPDELNPGRFLVTFTFDATVAGSITVYFFAKEGFACNLTVTKSSLLEPVTISFKEGLGQKFKQPSGTGIDFSMFDEAELMTEGEIEAYPLAVRAEASPSADQMPAGEQNINSLNTQITLAVFEKKDKGEYQVHVMKQILWVNGTRYELQEIYGIGNSVDGDFDGNDPGKECAICLSEPRDTAVLPCRHMCMCSGCAKVLRFQTKRCPICRQPVERLLEIKVSRPEEQQDTDRH